MRIFNLIKTGLYLPKKNLWKFHFTGVFPFSFHVVAERNLKFAGLSAGRETSVSEWLQAEQPARSAGRQACVSAWWVTLAGDVTHVARAALLHLRLCHREEQAEICCLILHPPQGESISKIN